MLKVRVDSVTVATEELSSSIKKISENMVRSKDNISDIVKRNKSASLQNHKLHKNTLAMQDVVDLIDDISQKVNLLALNATIEAARAGEAGKGFAVVANEVRNLAAKTTDATNDISEQITLIQENSEAATAKGDEIASATQEVNAFVSTLASALEEQLTVTSHITSNMTGITSSVTDLDGRIQQLTK